MTRILTNKSEINVQGELTSSRCKVVLCIDTGEVFASVTDAAKHAETYATEMSKHLHGKYKTIKGKRYVFLSKMSENLENIFANMRKLQEKANKYDAIIAEIEAAQRAEEEARLAEEKRIADIEKARKKWERRKEIRQRKEEEQAKAKALEIEAYDEYIALVGNANESEVAV